MDFKLIGKRALITGSSAGLGETMARMLAAEGAEVIIHGRNVERTHKVMNEIAEAGGKATAAIGDLSTDAGADAAASAALAGGPIDILVNNAGFYGHTSWANTSTADWLDVYNVNVVSYVRMIQRIVPAMKEKRMGSHHQHRWRPRRPAYQRSASLQCHACSPAQSFGVAGTAVKGYRPDLECSCSRCRYESLR